jgi:hypothetical protein
MNTKNALANSPAGSDHVAGIGVIGTVSFPPFLRRAERRKDEQCRPRTSHLIFCGQWFKDWEKLTGSD